MPTKDNDSAKGLGSYIMETRTKADYFLKREHIRARPVTETEKRTILHTRMYLSYYDVSKAVLDNVPRNYRSLREDRVTRGIPVEHIAAGLSYFMLKEAGYGVTLRKHSNQIKVEFATCLLYTSPSPRDRG